MQERHDAVSDRGLLVPRGRTTVVRFNPVQNRSHVTQDPGHIVKGCGWQWLRRLIERVCQVTMGNAFVAPLGCKGGAGNNCCHARPYLVTQSRIGNEVWELLERKIALAHGLRKSQ